MTKKAALAEQEPSSLLKNLVPLNALPEEHLGQLLSRIRLERVAPGGYLFREGDTDHEHVYLLEGRVSLLSGGKAVDSVQSGTNTARFALAHQWPRKFSARAAGEVRFARIDSHALSEHLVRTQTQSYRVSDLDTDSDASGDWMSRVLRSGVFQQIPAANIQAVLQRMESVKVRSGQCVLRQGAEGDYYYVIIRGAAAVTRSMNGQVQELARLEVGDGFGEQALISGAKRSSSVSMLRNGALMRLKKDDFEELLRRPLIRLMSMEQAQARAKQGAIWLDVSPPGGFASGHPSGAINLPLEVLRRESTDLEAEDEYLIFAENTGISEVAAFLLRERGFDAIAVDISTSEAAAPAPSPTPEELAGDVDSITLPLDDTGSAPAESSMLLDSGLANGQPAPLDPASQARFQKVLYQRIAEIRQLKRSLEGVTADKLRLEKSVERLETENADLRDRLQGMENKTSESESPLIDTAGRETLEARISELTAELDDLQEVLQEASAEESRQQWQRNRLEARVKSLETALDEQRQLNQVLREENDETIRRLEDMRDRSKRSPANNNS